MISFAKELTERSPNLSYFAFYILNVENSNRLKWDDFARAEKILKISASVVSQEKDHII